MFDDFFGNAAAARAIEQAIAQRVKPIAGCASENKMEHAIGELVSPHVR